MLAVLGIGLCWMLLDQWTKYLAVAQLTTLMPPDATLGERLSLFFGTDDLRPLATVPAKVLGDVWEHLYVQNPAGMFSLLLDTPLWVRKTVFIAAAVVASGGLLYAGWRNGGAGRWKVRAPLGFVLGGALGNLIDRTIHGYVIDFIHWHWEEHSWPPFNLADTAIVCGVVAIVLFGGPDKDTDESEEKKKKKK